MDETDSNDAKFGMPPFSMPYYSLPTIGNQPYLEIVEQPQSRGFRFRYECEGKSHGGLQGESSRREKRSYPAVRICNYVGQARINVSLVTDEKEPRPHAHELIGKNCANGTCVTTVKSDGSPVSFPHLGIRHVTKKSVSQILTNRLREMAKADKMMDGGLGQDADRIHLSDAEEAQLYKLAELQAKNMPLSVVRLSFRAYLLDGAGNCRVLPAAVSTPIFDSKAPCASLLKICRMDKVGGSCTGNEEVFLLCDKVQRDDIAVRFYEQDDEGNVKWEDYGNFSNHDVHRQYAIVFRSPAYVSVTIDRPVAVHIQLKRFSDGEVSDPKTFTYYPQQTDLEDIQKKRRKQIPNFTNGESLINGNGTGTLSFHPQFHFTAQSTCRTFQANGHAGAYAHPAIPLTVASRLEEDSASSYVELVARGTPSSASQVIGKDSIEPTASPGDLKTTTTTSDAESLGEAEKQAPADVPHTDTAESHTQTDAGQDVVLGSLLKNLALRTTESVMTYAQTSDARHLLLPARQLIKAPNTDGDNAVHLSVIHCQRTAAENLLSALSTLPNDLAIDDRNDLLQSPLQLAVITRQPELVNLLLVHGANPVTVHDRRNGDTLLHLSARNGNAACLCPLLNHWPRQAHNADNFGFTALHLAVRGGHLSCAKLLVTVVGAGVNEGDGQTGRTALHHAVLTDNLAIVGYLLLECSADVDKPDSSGNTALHLAVVGGRLGVAALLIAANADPDMENCGFDSDASDLSDYVSDENESSSDEQTDSPADKVAVDTVDVERSGKTPRQMAAGDDQMLRILAGEPYSSVKSAATERGQQRAATSDIRLKSVCDSGIDSILELEKSDLDRLDAVVRMKLSKLLDPARPTSDWRELASKLGLSHLVSIFELQKNPTCTLLDNYELANGSVAQLRKYLVEIKRDDAVKLLDEVPPATYMNFPVQL